MIEQIVQLGVLVMVIDNDADEEEMRLFQDIPRRMTEHLEDRAGVNLVIKVGSMRSSKTKNQLDGESEHSRSNKDLATLANETIAKYNQMDEGEADEWIISLAKEIKGKWIRFHTLKLLVDMAAADSEIKSEEVGLISAVAQCWGLEEDALDFLYLKTRTEWVYAENEFRNSGKKKLNR